MFFCGKDDTRGGLCFGKGLAIIAGTCGYNHIGTA
jgi:hypothetical protein